jgi:hypothetical protein
VPGSARWALTTLAATGDAVLPHDIRTYVKIWLPWSSVRDEAKPGKLVVDRDLALEAVKHDARHEIGVALDDLVARERRKGARDPGAVHLVARSAVLVVRRRLRRG